MFESPATPAPKPTFFGSISTEKRWLLFVVLPISMLVYVLLIPLVDASAGAAKLVDIVFIILENLAVFIWCGLDSRERGYKLHRLFGFAVIFLGLVALVYYLFRSRGLRGGFVSFGWLLVYIIGCYVVVLFAALVIYAGLVGGGVVPSSMLR